jgi:heme oxygenase
MTNLVTMSVDKVPPLLEALREGTRATHERIESVTAMRCLLAPDLSSGEYVTILRAMHAFRSAMQVHLAPHLPHISENTEPNLGILTAIAEDLAWFGSALPPPYDGSLCLADAKAALGALYVVEGSALGGRVIGRAVAQSLGVSPGRGGSFFCGPTADAARQRWLAFCATLKRAGEGLNQEGVTCVVAGADATFCYLERLLAGGPAYTTQRCPREHERSVKTSSSVRALAIAQAI